MLSLPLFLIPNIKILKIYFYNIIIAAMLKIAEELFKRRILWIRILRFTYKIFIGEQTMLQLLTWNTCSAELLERKFMLVS